MPMSVQNPKKAFTLFTLNLMGYAIRTATISLTLKSIKFLEMSFYFPNSGISM